MHFQKIILSGILFLAASIPAKSLYVAPAGNDALSYADCGFYAPWKTISKAAASAYPGDSVYVLPGTYIDNSSDYMRAFNPARSGTASAKIVFKSYLLHQAVVQSRANSYPAWGLNARKHIVLDGFRVIGGIGARENADSSVIRNCDVTNGFIQFADVSLHWGIYVAGANGVLVEDNYIHAPSPIGNKSHNTAAVMVIGVPGPARNNIIRNNEAYCAGTWYNAFGQKAGNVDNNEWYRNFAQDGVTGFLGMGSTDNSKYSQLDRFHENIILRCANAFETHHMTSEFKIWNNTAYGCANFMNGGYLSDASGLNKAHRIWNNIVTGSSSGYVYRRDNSTVDWAYFLAYSDYNAFFTGKVAVKNYSTAYATLQSWQSASGRDAMTLNRDPLLINPAGYDFRLQAGSPAIGKGVVVQGNSTGYDGHGPDMGAYPIPSEGAKIGIRTY